MHNDHYRAKVQPIDLIEAFDLNFNRGCIVKYVSRCGRKQGEAEIKELEKALFYLEREINRIKENAIFAKSNCS